MPLGIFLSTLSLRRATTGNASGIHTHWISIHALLAESDGQIERRAADPRDFYPRSPCGERRMSTGSRGTGLLFLSTLSLRRATGALKHVHQTEEISIHALLAESDQYRVGGPGRRPDFYPRSPCGERRPSRPSKRFLTPFLSTLSLRRATFDMAPYMVARFNFYPRSPCGERPTGPDCQGAGSGISIHALLAESDLDGGKASGKFFVFLSTLSLRRAT